MASVNDEKKKSGDEKKKSGYDYNQAKNYVFNFIKTIIDEHGPRLPGSEEERAASIDIEKYMQEATGKDNKRAFQGKSRGKHRRYTHTGYWICIPRVLLCQSYYSLKDANRRFTRHSILCIRAGSQPAAKES